MLQTAIQRIAACGVTPTDGDDQRARKGLFNVAAVLVGLVFILAIGPFYLYFHEPIAGWAYVFVGAFICINLAFVLRIWGTYDRFLAVFSFIVLPTHLFVYVTLGGFVESGGILLWGLAHPVMSNLVLHGSRSAIFWFVLYLLNLLIGVTLTPFLTPTTNIPGPAMLAAFGLSVGLISFIITALMVYFVRQMEMAYRLLRGEQEKSEGLLLNILPRDIAEILKNEDRLIADHFEGASILFADVVDFTPLSAQMSPPELVALLNDVFSHFDALVEQHGLEKIKTIGDCYMVASGIPLPRPDHAQALAQLALEMQSLVKDQTFRGRKLSFRIGINSGPVVAGVIGRKKFIYDLWGDAVNTASRMESHGQGGMTQITGATYALIKDAFICEPQGVIKVKGKGDMEVWYLTGRRNE